MHLSSDRLTLRDFTLRDLGDFAKLHANPESMLDLGGPISKSEAFWKLDGYMTERQRFGYSRWAVCYAGFFVGYVGICHHNKADHPLGVHDEIGWRLLPEVWGQGIASEAALMALSDAQSRLRLTNILAYTQQSNTASRAVMNRLGFIRDASLDFSEHYAHIGDWHGQVWRVPQDIGRGGIE